MRITNIDTLSALFDRLITERINRMKNIIDANLGNQFSKK